MDTWGAIDLYPESIPLLMSYVFLLGKAPKKVLEKVDIWAGYLFLLHPGFSRYKILIWWLLNGIDMHRTGIAIRMGLERSLLVHPCSAKTPFSWLELTEIRATGALHDLVLHFHVVGGLHRGDETQTLCLRFSIRIQSRNGRNSGSCRDPEKIPPWDTMIHSSIIHSFSPEVKPFRL